MTQWNLIFDVARCNSCNNCVLATKDEYLGNTFPGYSEPAPDQGKLWLTLKRHERGAHPMLDVSHYISTCHQCDDAPCIKASTADAITKRDDGIVVIDPVAARGRKDLVEACPYGQIHWNDERQLPQKWSFDVHLLDAGWKEPHCSKVCPTQALVAVKLSDSEMQAKAERQGLVRAEAKLGAKPRSWLRNYDRVSANFLGGTLVHVGSTGEECAEGCTLRLFRDDGLVAETLSDAFGDFKFEPLPGEGETYRLAAISPAGMPLFEGDFPLTGSSWVGLIELSSTPL